MGIDYSKRSGRPGADGATTTVSLSKVTLTKTSPTVSLTKQSGQLRVNLNWDAQPASAKPAGFLKKLAGSRGIDLDLGCLYELTDGRKGVVQALGNSFGSLDQPPYILLSGDDRSGINVAGEDLFVNLARAGEIRRVLVFACIYDGVPSFDQANAVVTLSPAAGPSVEISLDEAGGKSRMCAIALLEGNGTDLTVRREVRYVDGAQRGLDQAYGWGMNWSAGRK
ncbi:MAG: terA [Pseudonocardiales bacterium]|nr:terA [Pseudonocardiales bacterium]